ncbi:MAG: hypothetical protein RL172_2789 [Bacteroidota bacterium]
MLTRLILLTASISLLHCAAAQQSEKVYLIKAGKLYDSEKNIFVANQQVLVRGTKIEKVGANLQKPDGAEVINLPGATITPGLIDAHTHVLTLQKLEVALEQDVLENTDIDRSLRAVQICRSYLQAGFTSIRDLGNSGMFLDLTLQKAIRKGWVQGPHMVISGPILSPEDGQYFNLAAHNRHIIEDEYRVIKNVADARQAVKDHISMGAEVIKVVMGDGRLTLPLNEVKMIVETAHSYGIKVTAHATYDELINRALEAGVDGIEHGYNISDSLLEKMARQKVYLVPTYSNKDCFLQLFADNNSKQTPEQLQGLDDFLKSSNTIVKKAFEKGVMVINGSDMYIYSKNPGLAAKGTLLFFYEAWTKPADVLKSATLNAAIACGIDRYTGVIKEKMSADIVVFEGDLEKDFKTSVQQVKLVMKAGEIMVK